MVEIVPIKYRVGAPGHNALYIEQRGNDTWAVTDGSYVLNKDGGWEYEPLSSSRTDEFIARTRFTLAEAKERAMFDYRKNYVR